MMTRRDMSLGASAAAVWALSIAAPDLARACCDSSEIVGTSEDGDIVVFTHIVPRREHAYCVASKTEPRLDRCFSIGRREWKRKFASAEKNRGKWGRPGAVLDPRKIRAVKQRWRVEFLEGTQRYLRRRGKGQTALGWHGHEGMSSPDKRYEITTSGDFVTLLQIEDKRTQIVFPVAAFIPRAPPFKTWQGAEYFRAISMRVVNGAIAPMLLRKVVWGKDKVVVLVGVHDGKCGVNDRIYEISYADLQKDLLGDIHNDLLRIAGLYFSRGRMRRFRGERMWSCPWKIQGEGSVALRRICEQYTSRGPTLISAGTGIASLSLARKIRPLSPRLHHKMIVNAVRLFRWGIWDYYPFMLLKRKAKRLAYRATMRAAFRKYLTNLVSDFSTASPRTEVKRYARRLQQRAALRKVLESLKAGKAIDRLRALAGD